MNRTRLLIAGATAIVLTALLGWQIRREHLVRACLQDGGIWHGALSTCRRPIIQRELQRS